MWRVYCGSTDGVAIQTTLAELQASVGSLSILKVKYTLSDPKQRPVVATTMSLVGRKRRPYAYEKEHRIVSVGSEPTALYGPESPHIVVRDPVDGFALPWEPEQHIDRVLIHPGADEATEAAIRWVVEAMSPALTSMVVKSGMAEPPGFCGVLDGEPAVAFVSDVAADL